MKQSFWGIYFQLPYFFNELSPREEYVRIPVQLKKKNTEANPHIFTTQPIRNKTLSVHQKDPLDTSLKTLPCCPPEQTIILDFVSHSLAVFSVLLLELCPLRNVIQMELYHFLCDFFHLFFKIHIDVNSSLYISLFYTIYSIPFFEHNYTFQIVLQLIAVMNSTVNTNFVPVIIQFL